MHWQTQPTKENLMEAKLEQLLRQTRLLEHRLKIVRLEQMAEKQKKKIPGLYNI